MKHFPLAALFLFALNSPAQWTSNVSSNTPVSIVTKSQQKVHMSTDGANGAIMTWEDNRNSSSGSTDIYAQRINSAGYSKWLNNGMAVCSNTASQQSPAITDAGNGDVIITWQDTRNGNYDIYAQKIDSSGNTLWSADGIVVCNKPTNQKGPKIVSDNTGGAIIVWEDSLNFYWDIYAQRISSSGTALWAPNGVAVCTAQNTQNNPRIDLGLAGGAIITWQDKRNNSDYDIYAQSLDASGVAQWTANGVVICNSINTQSNPKIEPDGSNGAVIAWEDKRNGADYDIYAQRVNSSGIVQWTSNGLGIANTSFNQSAPEMKFLGGNAVCISWKDARSGNNAIYAQLINLSGTTLLTSNGIQLSSGLKSINPNNIADGTGGVIIAWQDSTASGWNISTQKLNSSGIAQWPLGGVTVSNAVNDQLNVAQVADGSGGAIFGWEDHRNGTDYDVYSQKIYSNGTTVVSINETQKNTQLNATCFPNPTNNSSIIKLNNNSKDWIITIFDITGKPLETQQLKHYEVFYINALLYPKGIYFYNISLKDNSAITHGKFIIDPNE